ncbi:hypothetical protein ACFVZ3_22130 [Kitasatospora purpeofusca]|uniref:hypothetical protein n=1 Tax=Kitasatospora purpeofusca TaxID=67352 RepID=UPI0036B18F08
MPDSAHMGALSELISSTIARPGMSYSRFAKLAVDPETGRNVGQTWLFDLTKGEVSRAPLPYMMRALAAGAGLPLERIQAAAAAQFLGYTATQLSDLPDDLQVIVGHLVGMDPTDLPRVRAVIEALSAHDVENSGQEEV